MQNLPITATQPAPQAQTPSSADNATTPAAEPFGNVLARQRASASESSADAQDSGQPAPSSTEDARTIAAANEKLVELQAPTPDGVGTLPGDMLAALLSPTPSSTNKAVASKEKTGLQEPAAVNMLPGDMLATLLPTTPLPASATPLPAPVTLSPAPAIPHGADTAKRPQTAASGVSDSARQPIGSQELPSLFRTQNTPPTAITGTNTVQDNAFSAALEKSGKDAANMTQLSSGTAKISAQAAQPDATALASQTQIGPVPIAASLNGPTQAVINTPVTHDAWGDEFNQKITWMASQHEQSAELHLNPPHLGPLDVVLKVNGDQATAMFTSPHAAVRDAVEQALPRLREMLADNGIMLGNAMVSDQSSREQQAGLADKQQKGVGSLSGRESDVNLGLQANGTIGTGRRHQGMVDTFV